MRDNPLAHGAALVPGAWLVLGVLLCFFGRRWFRQLTALLGAGVGAAIGWRLAEALHVESPLGAGALTAAGAVMLAVVCAASIYVGIFLLGFNFGALLTAAVVLLPRFAADLSPLASRALVLLGGALGGILALFQRERVLAVGTACLGAGIISHTAFFLIHAALTRGTADLTRIRSLLPEMYSVGWIAAAAPLTTVALAITGALYQLARPRT